jgi:hypothetical protein
MYEMKVEGDTDFNEEQDQFLTELITNKTNFPHFCEGINDTENLKSAIKSEYSFCFLEKEKKFAFAYYFTLMTSEIVIHIKKLSLQEIKDNYDGNIKNIIENFKELDEHNELTQLCLAQNEKLKKPQPEQQNPFSILIGSFSSFLGSISPVTPRRKIPSPSRETKTDNTYSVIRPVGSY